MSLPEVGQKLHAKFASDGVFYPAEVVAVSTNKKYKKTPVQVKFKGYDDAGAWVSLDDLKCKSLGLTGGDSKSQSEPAAKGKAKAKVEGKTGGKVVERKEMPDIGDTVRTTADDGKSYTAKVVAAKIQIEFSDGTKKWCTVDDLKFKRAPPPEAFPCTQCGQEFTSESGRDNHWWDKHIVTCTECGKVFDNDRLRDEHWWDAHIVSCKQCGKICSNIGALVEHTRQEHAVICKQCGKECSSIKSLVHHARDVHQYSQNLVDVSGGKKEAGGEKEAAKKSGGKKK